MQWMHSLRLAAASYYLFSFNSLAASDAHQFQLWKVTIEKQLLKLNRLLFPKFVSLF